MILGLGFALSCMLISCNSGREKESPSIKILSPENKADVFVPKIQIVFQYGGIEESELRENLYYKLNDSGNQKVAIPNTFEISGLVLGENIIEVGIQKDDVILAFDNIEVNYLINPDSVVVIFGEGSGIYNEGESVTITADQREIPYVFGHWIGDNQFLLDSTLSPTFFNKPAQRVKLEAVFKIDSGYFHSVKVVNGLGSGKFLPGTSVNISAQLESPFLFTYWSGGAGFLDSDSLQQSITFTMPDIDVILTAKWIAQNVSFANHVFPIFESSCNNQGCHNANGAPPYLTHESIYADKISIAGKTQSRNMPPPLISALSNEEIAIIQAWVNEGALNN